MTPTGDARSQILRAIRENLTRSASGPQPRGIAPGSAEPVAPTADPGPAARGSKERGDVVSSFAERLAAVGAQCTVVRGESEAAGALAGILSGAGARRVVGSDAPLVQRLLGPLRDRLEIAALERLSRDDLFACDAGVTTAQWGIAETGTLVLESARELSRLLSLVPPIHVALLSARCICDSLGEALARVRQPGGGVASHVITFITGPSRTSDIELTLVMGVHGPQTVHVLLMEET